jgi:hypothetical protein
VGKKRVYGVVDNVSRREQCMDGTRRDVVGAAWKNSTLTKRSALTAAGLSRVLVL